LVKRKQNKREGGKLKRGQNIREDKTNFEPLKGQLKKSDQKLYNEENHQIGNPRGQAWEWADERA